MLQAKAPWRWNCLFREVKALPTLVGGLLKQWTPSTRLYHKNIVIILLEALRNKKWLEVTLSKLNSTFWSGDFKADSRGRRNLLLSYAIKKFEAKVNRKWNGWIIHYLFNYKTEQILPYFERLEKIMEVHSLSTPPLPFINANITLVLITIKNIDMKKRTI